MLVVTVAAGAVAGVLPGKRAAEAKQQLLLPASSRASRRLRNVSIRRSRSVHVPGRASASGAPEDLSRKGAAAGEKATGEGLGSRANGSKADLRAELRNELSAKSAVEVAADAVRFNALEFSSEEIEHLLVQKVGSGDDWCLVLAPNLILLRRRRNADIRVPLFY